MKNVLIFLFMSVQIILISAQKCLTISGIDSEFWHLCFENVTSFDNSKTQCKSFSLELQTQNNTTETYYSWFNKTISIQNQINAISRVFVMNLNSLIAYESYRIEDLKCFVNAGFDRLLKLLITSF